MTSQRSLDWVQRHDVGKQSLSLPSREQVQPCSKTLHQNLRPCASPLLQSLVPPHHCGHWCQTPRGQVGVAGPPLLVLHPPMGIEYGDENRGKETRTSVPLSPLGVCAWRTEAQPLARGSSLVGLHLQEPSCSLFRHLWIGGLTVSRFDSRLCLILAVWP